MKMEDIDVSTSLHLPYFARYDLINRLLVQLFDVNEAFAAQWLAVAKELGLPMDRSNVNGGAIGSSARIELHHLTMMLTQKVS